MPIIEVFTDINAPVERVFDLARNIDLHKKSTSRTREEAIGGVTAGLIGAGQSVTWRARHFGLWQELTVQITDFDPPHHFADVMVKGAFRKMEHHHHFAATPTGTRMRDVFTFESPLGFLGRFADWLFLARYMRKFLVERNAGLKSEAEASLP